MKIASLSGRLFVSCFLFNLILLAARRSNSEASLLGCSFFAFLTLGFFQVPNMSAVMFSGAGLLLILNQVQILLQAGFRDELTQIPNRRSLQQVARGLGQNYSLAMVDIDHFKKINDSYGHDLGDQVLRVVAGKLKQVGDGGKVFRYGGEEFCLLFKNRNAREINETLEQLREDVANYKMLLRDQKNRPKTKTNGERLRGASRNNNSIHITVSIGAADSTTATSFREIMLVADKAMYRAKRGGRNRVVLA